jgi:hypothetical protein
MRRQMANIHPVLQQSIEWMIQSSLWKGRDERGEEGVRVKGSLQQVVTNSVEQVQARSLRQAVGFSFKR